MTMHKGSGDAYTYSPQTEAGLAVQQTSVRWNHLVHGPAAVPRCEQSVIYYKSPFMAPSDDADLSRYEPVEGGGFRIRDGKGCFTRPIIWGNNQVHGGDTPIFAMKTGTGSARAGFDAEHACFPVFGRSATGAWKQPYPLLGFLRLGVPGEDGPAWFHERDGVETITRPGSTQYHLERANGVSACEITIAPLTNASGLVCRVRFERPQDLVWEYGDLYWDNGSWALIPEVNRNEVTIDGTTARLTEMNLGPALVLAGWDGTGIGEAVDGPLLDINNQGQIARFSTRVPREEYYIVAVWGVTGYDHALAEQMMERLDSRNTAHWPEERDRLKQLWFDAFITPHLNPEAKFRTAMRDPAGELQRMMDWWETRTAQVQISTPDPYFNNLITWVHTTSHYHQLGPGPTNSGSASDSFGHISPGWWGKLWGGDVEAVKTNLRLYGAMQLDEVTFNYADPNAVNRHYPVYTTVDGCIPWICSSLEPAVRENNNPWFLDQVWWVYAWTGDAQFVRDLWPIILRAVEWQCTINDPDGDGLFRDFYPFWAGDNACEGPKGVVAGALGWTTPDRAAKLAAVVADAESEQAYRAYADTSKAAIIRELWNEEIGVLGARGMEGTWREHMQAWQEALAVELGVVLMGRRDGNYPINCEITDNEIREPGFRHQYTTAIFTGLSDGITIAHNYIHHCPQYAINLGNNGFGRNYVEFNEIRFTNLEKLDAGAISCWMDESEDGEAYFPPTLIKPRAERSGHIIRYNLIADTCGCRIEDDDTLMPDNHLTKRFGNFSNAIYTDDGSSNCVISHNILIRAGVGIKLHTTKHQLVENNIIVDCLYQLELCNVVPHRSPIMMTTLKDFMRGNRFCRNIFYTTKALPAEPDFARISVYSDDFVQHDMMQRCDENLYFSETPVEWCGCDNGQHMMGKPRFTLADWQARGYDRHTVLADPQFADVAHEDFTLAPDSPALALGFQPIPFEKIGIRKVTER